MSKKRVILIISAILLTVISFSRVSIAGSINIYINGEDLTAKLKPINQQDQILVSARSLADQTGAEIKWKKSIRTLKLSKDDIAIKMMDGSNYIQINDRTVVSKAKMYIKDSHAYVPLTEVVQGFGYLTNRTTNSIYIFKPEAVVKEVLWEKNYRRLVIKMDKITPYRVNDDRDDPKKLVIEIDKASLAPNFKDKISSKNYYLEIKRSQKTARLQLILTGKYKIPYYNESCIQEEGNNLILNFYPVLESIKWTKDNKLEIVSSEKIGKPDISLLSSPRRMVMDFPDLRLNEYDIKLTENNYIKEVRVSQFKYKPLILRIVLELKDNKFLHSVNTDNNSKYVLGPAVKTEISNLDYINNKISFETSAAVDPEIFKLSDPDRIVINLPNTVRTESIKSKIEVNGNLIKNIRSSQFDEQIMRIVVDLNREVGYNWKRKEEKDGNYKNIIILGNTIKDMKVTDKKQNTIINIDFYEDVEYKVEKFSYPDRFTVDVLNTNINASQIDIPDAVGIVEDIRINKYTSGGKDYSRFVFELNQYKGYNIISENPTKNINITLDKEIIKEDKAINKEKNNKENNKKNDLIVIDPGHGGFDPGACGQSGLTEKEVNLSIARKVRDLLQNSGYNIMLTRDSDKFISLKKRVEIANKAEALLFVSIHNNSSCKKYSEGTETFLAPHRDEECLLLARFMQKELLHELKLLDRGVKKDNFYVIKYTNMPAVLIEIAFLSNPHEEALLESDLFRQKAASAVARAIKNYLREVN